MMTVKFSTDLQYSESASGKLANVELHFVAGPLEGLKLIGFGLWASKQNPGTFNVTFPARQYSVNGERRSFALLRPVATNDGQNRVRDAIVAAWPVYLQALADDGGDDSSKYKPEAAALYDGTPGSGTLPRVNRGRKTGGAR
jgi:hypothetical protein